MLAERVGWTGSNRRFSENVKRLRPEQRPIDPADRIVWLREGSRVNSGCQCWLTGWCAIGNPQAESFS